MKGKFDKDNQSFLYMAVVVQWLERTVVVRETRVRFSPSAFNLFRKKIRQKTEGFYKQSEDNLLAEKTRENKFSVPENKSVLKEIRQKNGGEI